MATKRFTFPDNFQWGTATAAHQVEGNNVNSDFWVLEHPPGSPIPIPYLIGVPRHDDEETS